MNMQHNDLSHATPAGAGFKAWLHRPYIDLGAGAEGGNVWTTGLVFACRAMVESTPAPRLHGILNPSHRTAILPAARLPAYDVDDPLDLPTALRTPAWSVLCDRLRHFADIDPEDRVRALWVLHRLCLHGAILSYAPSPTDREVRHAEAHAGIAYLRGLARFAFANDGTAALDTTELERVAIIAPEGGWARIEATYALAAAAAKMQHDPARLRHWLGELRRQIDRTDADAHTHDKLMSRFHRMNAFVPQFARDWTGMSAEMDLAQAYAEKMRHDTPETHAEWLTLNHAVRERRTKEALVLGDLDRAEAWARACVEHCPADARAWLELGQVLIERENVREALAAYRKAVRFGPPGTEIAWFMAGQCYEALDEPELAADAYLAALDLDPLAISAAQRLADLAPGLGAPGITTWAKCRSASLEAMEASRGTVPADDLKPYQQYEGVLGSGQAAQQEAAGIA